MTGAIDTLVSQAYGNKKYYLCGVYLNRARVVMTFLFIPQLILLYYIGDIFVVMGQPVNASMVCQTFVRYQLIGLFFAVQFE